MSKSVEIETFDSPWDTMEASPQEIAKMKIKSRLLTAVRKKLNSMEGTQAEKAKVAGVSQPRLNDLLRGRISRFSLDALITMAYALGLQVRVIEQAA